MLPRQALALVLAPFIVSCIGNGNGDGTAGAGEHTGDESDQLQLCPSATVEGLDVSEYQGSVDWHAVRGSGRAFAFIRVSDGTGHVDATFAANWPAAKAAGVTRGVYQFFRASEDGTAQADILLQHLGSDLGEIAPVADVEVTDGVGAGTLDAHLAQWVSRIQSATGKTPIIYTSPGLWPSLSGSSQFSGESLWVADWGASCPTLPGPWSAFHFWQYADNGGVPGISGAVDLDRFNGTLAQLQGAPPPSGPVTARPAAVSGCGVIEPGQGLVAGESYASCDGRFSLAMQTDGNLVLYRDGAGATWASNTSGSDGYVAVMQGDGNFVLYGHHSNPLWAAGTNGHDGANLALQDDGNLVVYAPGAKPVWASNTVFPAPPPAPSGCGTIHPGQGLTAGKEYASCDGRYTLAMQTDGNLVLYHNGVGALWATMTNGKDGYNAIMQGDGNFVLYDTKNRPLWASNTSGHDGAFLATQTDGNLVVYASDDKALWATMTNGK
jgi:GH25 family lysozyme M1 (1,4-beta-N-acetylmuramidase)